MKIDSEKYRAKGEANPSAVQVRQATGQILDDTKIEPPALPSSGSIFLQSAHQQAPCAESTWQIFLS
jgi:hypothetical protein